MYRLTGVIVSILIAAYAVSGCSGGSAGRTLQAQPGTPAPMATPSSGPSITSLSPTSVVAGSPDLTLTITGSDLAETTQIFRRAVWSVGSINTTLATKLISDTELTAVVPAALMSTPITVQIFVEYGDPIHSNAVSFVVSATSALSVSPALATLGPKNTQQFVATVNGKAEEAAWSVEEGDVGGTITTAGLYAVPKHSGTFHVTATLLADASKSAAATVNVVASGFTPTAAMQMARSGHTATLLKDGRVLIVGGAGDNTAELFDPASGAFSFTGPLVTGRSGATATLLSDGRVLVAGGFGLAPDAAGRLPVLTSAEIFDPVTGTFRAGGNLLQARRNHTATLLEDGRVLIAGGYFDAICITAAAELFDPATETFSSVGFMFSERVRHTATLLATGEALMVGGSNGCAPDSSDDPPWDPLFAELYEPNSRSFQPSGNMSTTRIDHAAIRLEDGKILVLGGIPPLQNLHEQPPNPSYAELYDPVGHTFSPIAGLTIAHERYTTTLLTSGTVLIAGGQDSAGNATSDVQLLDTHTFAVTASGGLASPRVGHTATLLRDGRVLVTGGTDVNGKALASAALYR
jgi:IPT/TIG domain/Galactose oxidase, central domain